MYSIIIDDEIKGMCDFPNYVKMKDGIWVNCSEKEHEAIAFESVAYPNAIAKQLDGSEVVFAQGVKLDEANGRIDSNDDALMEIAELVAGLMEG